MRTTTNAVYSIVKARTTVKRAHLAEAVIHMINVLEAKISGLENQLDAKSLDIRAQFERANEAEKKLDDLAVVLHGFDARLEEKDALLADQTKVNNALVEEVKRLGAPVPLILFCPKCNTRHLDAGAMATTPHHTHACQACGFLWAPAVVPTVGVAFLPGCRDVDGKS